MNVRFAVTCLRLTTDVTSVVLLSAERSISSSISDAGEKNTEKKNGSGNVVIMSEIQIRRNTSAEYAVNLFAGVKQNIPYSMTNVF